jgi:predicted RND superfamily exporter protein
MPPESRNKVILDSNDDSIYDTAIILIGITQDIDQEELVKNMNTMIDGFEESKMTLTGPIPMTQAITKRTYSEFMKTLPAAIVLVAGILILFHRNWKIVIITGLPVLCSLAITFGILGGANLTLTPQVVLIAPILIALGVAYGLYIANRYSDESQIEDRQERIKVAVKTTGKAIFLSALTTAIGFASLLTVQMIPLQVLGFGLSIGIMICYAITMLTVPSLVMALNYQKKGEIKVKEKLGNIPVVHRKKIMAIASIFVIFSVILIPSVVANMDFIKMAPQDEPVILKMREYSDKFGGGQQGMILIEGRVPIGNNVRGSMRDAEVLEDVDWLSGDLRGVKNTNVISIVDIMKMIKPPEPQNPQAQIIIDLIESYTYFNYNSSFWDLIQNSATDNKLPGMDKTIQVTLIDIFYNTLSTEMRGMFINSDYSKTILYIDMPTMDVVNTKKAVLEVNDITERYQQGIKTSHLTGFGAILVAVNDMLVESAIWSTVIALILVLFVLAVIFKSVKFSAITLIPVCFVVILQPITLITIGGLGGLINPSDPYFSGELNLFTAVLGSIIVGIGIDFGIHMTERIRERGLNVEGIKHGVATSGMAFVEATVTMIGGLSAVFLIDIPAIQEFILLVMILLTYSVIGALFILTAIYSIIVRRRESLGLPIEGVKGSEDYTSSPFREVTGDKLPLKASVKLDSMDR